MNSRSTGTLRDQTLYPKDPKALSPIDPEALSPKSMNPKTLNPSAPKP